MIMFLNSQKKILMTDFMDSAGKIDHNLLLDMVIVMQPI